MKIDLPNDDGTNIIQLSVIRESRYARALFKKCAHNNIEVDTSLTVLTCKDCKEKLNPIEWVATVIEEWYRVENLYKRYKEAKVAYEAKQRCRCEHCNKITSVKPATAAEIREFKKAQP